MPSKRPEAHDILLIPPLKPFELESVAQDPDRGPTGMLKMSIMENGQYAGSEILDAQAEGARKVYGIARPGAPERDEYGPAFAILPIRPDPGSQSDTCFLINTENLFLPNPWTAADWDAFGPDSDSDPMATSQDAVPINAQWEASEKDCRFLVAGPQGKVHLIDTTNRKVEEVAGLKSRTGIWSQLREGLIVGSVLYDGKVLPLVNIASINIARRPQSGDKK